MSAVNGSPIDGPAKGRAMLALLLGALALATAFVVPLVGGLLAAACAAVLLTSKASAACPHCAAPLRLPAGTTALNCPGCQHRLVVRGDHLLDMT